MPKFRWTTRSILLAVVLPLVLLASACTSPPPPEEPQPTPSLGGPAAEPARVAVDLRTLVLDDGSSMIRVLTDRLTREGVQVERVLLGDPQRKAITRGSLATDADGTVTAHYSGIVAPSLTSAALSADERTALTQYASTFRVRTLSTDVWSLYRDDVAEVPFGGAEVTFSEAAGEDPFGYLQKSIRFDDSNDPSHVTPARRPDRLPAGAEYEPLLTMANPKGGERVNLLALVRDGAREEMLVAFDGDEEQSHLQALAHGMISWLNRDVSTSFNRNYFSVDNDDVLLPNAQWNIEGDCEVGRNCPDTVEQLPPVRMTAEDIDYLVDWQRRSGIKVHLALNGAGAAQYATDHAGHDPLMERMVEQRAELRFLNHTWSHHFLGCDRVLLPEDWRCLGDAQGTARWPEEKVLYAEVAKNQEFMKKNNLENFNVTELVTGEHSGLAKPPQQPDDNPNLGAAISRAGIVWVASDNSTETEPRPLGSATTVPRYPIDLDYNTPTAPQVVDLYNYVNTSRADGGSGACETTPGEICVKPLPLETGYAEVLVPMEGEKAYHHTVGNDARPHFVHQTNFTGERLIYQILDDMLERYNATFAENSPLLNPTMSEAGTSLVNQRDWKTSAGEISAKVAGRVVTVTNKGDAAVTVPLTLTQGSSNVREGRLAGAFGAEYQGQSSEWVVVEPGTTATFELPETSGFATEASWPGAVS